MKKVTDVKEIKKGVYLKIASKKATDKETKHDVVKVTELFRWPKNDDLYAQVITVGGTVCEKKEDGAYCLSEIIRDEVVYRLSRQEAMAEVL